MKAVVLFGGGDGGGLIITDNGVRPIPPFDPAIRANLKSAAAMVTAVAKTRDARMQSKASKLAISLCNLAVEQVEQVVGPLDADRSLIYQDDDGGFYCGSTGKPPTPLPWPPQSIPSVPELINAGVIEPDVVELMHKALAQKIPFAKVFDDPRVTAEKLGVTLSEQSARDIHSLAPSQVDRIKDPVDREIVQFFHKVVADGRYVQTWLSRPYDVEQALKVELSESALERLVAGGVASGFAGQGHVADDGAIAAGIAWAGVCIVIGIVLGAAEMPVEEIVKDVSGIAKF